MFLQLNCNSFFSQLILVYMFHLYCYQIESTHPYDTCIYAIYLYDTQLYDTYLYDTSLYDTHLYDTYLYDTSLYDTSLYDTYLYDTNLNDTYLYDIISMIPPDFGMETPRLWGLYAKICGSQPSKSPRIDAYA